MKNLKNYISAIDIGSNSIHLVTAEVNSFGHMKVRQTDKITARLGEYLDEHQNMQKKGIDQLVIYSSIQR